MAGNGMRAIFVNLGLTVFVCALVVAQAAHSAGNGQTRQSADTGLAEAAQIREALIKVEERLARLEGQLSRLAEGPDKKDESRDVLWRTMLFTGLAAVAAIVYAGLTFFLLLRTHRANQASTIVQLVTNNRYLSEYAQRDAELMDVIRGAAGEKLTPKQFNYVSLIAGQVMTAFECKRLGVLSNELFRGIRKALEPMLKSAPIRAAIIEVVSVHPKLREEIERWVNELE